MPLLDRFASLPDPRRAHGRRHRLSDLLFIALCATLCGADSFQAIERWARAKQDWLTQHLDLQQGIASHDTFNRVFGLMDLEALLTCFTGWTREVARQTQGEIIALDGKTLRHSFDTASGQAALHLVSAWACQNRLSLGQRLVDDKSNEITAIPELLRLLDLSGCLVTLDAMGCQREIAQQIVEQKADYVLALKANHASLHAAAEQFFDQALENQWHMGEGSFARPIAHVSCQSVEKGHGRVEVRRCFVVEAGDWLDPEQRWADANLQSVACVECERVYPAPLARLGRTVRERRFFLCSLPISGRAGRSTARQVLRAVRSHWGIENRLHWVLDVTFGEDACRVRQKRAAQSLAALRRFTVGLLHREKESKMSLIGKRQTAGWDNDYLLKLLTLPEHAQEEKTTDA